MWDFLVKWPFTILGVNLVIEARRTALSQRECGQLDDLAPDQRRLVAQSPTQVQLAACRALGSGSRSSTSDMMNSWTRCGCEPPCPLPWTKLRCSLPSMSYTPRVVNWRMGLGSRSAKSGAWTGRGISGSGSLARCMISGSCSTSGHSMDAFDPYTSKLSRYWRATSNSER